MLLNKWWFGPLWDKAGEGEGGGGGESDDSGDSESSEEGTEEGEEGSEDSEEGDKDDKDGEEGEAEDLSEKQINEAKNLYKLLTNSSTQQQALRILAEQAGIELAGTKGTKKDVETVVEDTVKILEDALGKDLAWLAPKLAGAFDKLLEKSEGKTKVQLESLKQTQVAKEVDQAYETLARETKGQSRRFENKMVALADKLYPAPGMSTAEYIRHLYTIASASGGEKSAKQQLAEKINRNSKDVPGRIAESAAAGGSKKANSGRMSLKEAIRTAAEKQGYKGD